MASRLSQVLDTVRRRGGGFALQVLVNAVLPLIIYDTQQKALGDVKALIASSIPPILWSIVEFARHRRVDAISIIALAGIALSFIAFIGTGGAKFLQLRETLAGGVIGVAFVVSVIVRRPLIYYLARASMMRTDVERANELAGLRDNPFFKRTMTVMTLVWGVGLLAHTALNCTLVFLLSIPTYLAVAPIDGYAVAGTLSLWTFYYARRAQRIGDARRAAAAASLSQADAAAEPEAAAP